MGKYIRKGKIKGDDAVIDVVPNSQNSLGVRTRAKTLALQRLQSAKPSSGDDLAYLQLRSRRLAKVLPLINEPRKQNRKENPRQAKSGSVGSVSIECSKEEEGVVPVKGDEIEDQNKDLNIEASFGENSPDFDGGERSTRESTPCSLIKGSDIALTPGSATKRTPSAAITRRIQALQDADLTREIDQFFAFAGEEQRRLFTVKYNFDVANDVPLPGRYEWVKVNN